MPNALIKSGTAAFTNGSATVVGTGTTWASTVRPGHLIRSKTNNVFYEILTVGSNTSLTLGENWSGTTGTYGYEILPWFASEEQASTYLAALGATLLDRFGSILTFAGGSQTQTLNKATLGANVGSVLQVGGANRFREGLFGDDVHRLQRSADGVGWTDVLTVNRTTGAVAINGSTQLPVQASNTAVTPGDRLARVDGALHAALGHFGVYYTGSGNVLNIDTADGGTAGLVQAGGSNGGVFPLAGFFCFQRQRAYSNSAAVDTAVNYASSGAVDPRIMHRIRAGDGTVGPWRETYHRGNLVADVAQSGGVPTGGAMSPVISNANGLAWRFANGLQICALRQSSLSLTITTAIGAFFRDDTPPAWVFPAAFSEPPTVTFNIGSSYIWGIPGATSASQATRSALSPVTYTGSLVAYNLAIGRWF